ncbi:DUF1674 domain-containing protein [Bartonella sp. TP]|uniref:DUF1674 domain-containing protein n=1 Tax=Bartonella sp. TP TaxID=3057550 RepID=UPI0025B1ED41|nr:DUF1674 domain-containing protein [Bartonella sp. TP]MDN5248508.1 DUF1674 domain-containing protein [Alphaproteobacteria bacterium]WJW79567.1 DUF1674 domain-containing protein [Bartonella sp. TP]
MKLAIDQNLQAKRALAEAAARRKIAEQNLANLPKELGGRDGPDPVRYGDWELKGRTIDF